MWRPGTQFILFGAVGHIVRTLLTGLLLAFVQIRKRHPSSQGALLGKPSMGWLSSPTCPPLDTPFCAVPNLHNCTEQCCSLFLGTGKVGLGWFPSSYPVVHPLVIFTHHSSLPYLIHAPACPTILPSLSTMVWDHLYPLPPVINGKMGAGMSSWVP